MTNRVDHEKVNKEERVRRHGREPIEAKDRTLHPSGRPPSSANTKPKQKPPGYDVSPVTVKEEPIPEAIAAIVRAVSEADDYKRRKAEAAARKAAQRNTAKTQPPGQPVAKESKDAGLPSVVRQQRPRGRSHAVVVEIKSTTPSNRPPRHQ